MRNSIAHLSVAFTTTDPACTGGEPKRGGGELRAYVHATNKLRNVPLRAQKHLRGQVMLPKHQGEVQMAEAALSTVRSTAALAVHVEKKA